MNVNKLVMNQMALVLIRQLNVLGVTPQNVYNVQVIQLVRSVQITQKIWERDVYARMVSMTT